MATIMRDPAHPGEVLREWLEGLEIPSQAVFADMLSINRVTLSRILNKRSGVTADVDVRLAEVLGTNPGFWLALQSQFDLAQAIHALKKSKRKFKRVENPLAKTIKQEAKPLARAA